MTIADKLCDADISGAATPVYTYIQVYYIMQRNFLPEVSNTLSLGLYTDPVRCIFHCTWYMRY
jgi:hypothetical protein